MGPGHEAWEKVRIRTTSNGHGGNLYDLCRFEFIRDDGKKEKFQATVRACGNSSEECSRVARLCYVKFKEGWSMEQVLEYRTSLYEEVSKKLGTYVEKEVQPHKKRSGRRKREGKVEAGAAQDVKRRKRSSGLEEQVESLRAANKLAGAIRIEGRDVGAKNASINGIYALVDGGFEGSSAYEKAGGGQPRFLFYSN